MNQKTYPESYHPEIGALVEKFLRRRVREGFSARQFCQEHHAELDYRSPQSAETYLREVRKGCIYGSSSSDSALKEKNLRRLSRLLYLLGVPEEHLLIEKLDELEPERFDYPPEEDSPAE